MEEFKYLGISFISEGRVDRETDRGIESQSRVPARWLRMNRMPSGRLLGESYQEETLGQTQDMLQNHVRSREVLASLLR